MQAMLAIRREDKNEWERRAPLTPDHVRELVKDHGLVILVQPCQQRAFLDQDYADAGAILSEDLSGASIVMGVKEIPAEKLLPGRPHIYFSHVFKGQPYNMSMLRSLMEQGCTLLDYEMIADRRGKRLVFFGRHAGYAGMLDTLWTLGRRLAWEGISTPFEEVRMAHQYSSLDEALIHLSKLGDRIRHQGLPVGLRPLVFAFMGSGNVSRGAQEVFDRLPFQELDPGEVVQITESRDTPNNILFKVCLERRHRVRRKDGGSFDIEGYRSSPEDYESAMVPLLPHLTVLVNGIFWESRRPVLVSREHLCDLSLSEAQPKLRVIGDITCDIDGAVAATTHPTEPGDPVYVYDPVTGETSPGVAGRGFAIMAVDNLPCELPVESSQHFGDSLLRFVPAMARCDWTAPLDKLDLPEEIKSAIIVHQGRLTHPFAYLEQHLPE